MDKQEQVAVLVEYIIDSWDMSALISYASDSLMEYYSSPEGEDDFNTNYDDMVAVMGTPKKYHGGE